VAAGLAAAGDAGATPERVVLTASSSESYALLFKVLADPGDAVLVPEPSYPLFDYLARLEGVEPVPYRLAYDGAWHMDFASVDEALARAGARARALIVVNPNNPTGSYLKRDELAPLAARAEDHGLAVISDEVFAPYAAADDARRVAALAGEKELTSRVLTFTLGGLSKACGMPQLKLGWTAVAGPRSLAEQALARLELVADTYLSVGGPVQAAAPRLLELGRDARRAIAARERAAGRVDAHAAAERRRLGRDPPRAGHSLRRGVGDDLAPGGRRPPPPRLLLRLGRWHVPGVEPAAGGGDVPGGGAADSETP
jgi:aspartate/methionine/tyrosine aminotransferase